MPGFWCCIVLMQPDVCQKVRFALQLLAEMTDYRLGNQPFLVPLTSGDISSLKAYWQDIQKFAAAIGPPLQLPALVSIVHAVKPHAADCEKNFSTMSFFESPHRSQLNHDATTQMTTVKMHYQNRDTKR